MLKYQKAKAKLVEYDIQQKDYPKFPLNSNELPRYSELDQSLWSDYLKSPKAPRMLWPAQQLIGEKGVLRGQSAIVQLPTGVGKTKSIELIIRSSFASDRATTAIIVAPLRALCNEIANDMI